MIDLSLLKLTPADDTHYEFLFQLKKAAMGPYVKKIWGWDEQHQRERHKEDWQEKRPSLILYKDKPIGCILINNEDDHIYVGRFYILPKYQSQGIGTHILKDIFTKADKTNKSTTLAVLKINPALALYKRLGFQINGTNEYQYLMERKPGGKKTEYKAVIFDLFGTLVENFPASKSFENLSKMASILVVSPDDFAAEWRKNFAVRMTGAYQDRQACISNICRRLGVKPSDAKIDKAASVRFGLNKKEVAAIKPGALDVLSYLKANGYKTALLSNCSMETTKLWPKTKLARLIDVPVMSSAEGIMKPDPRLFQIALKKLAVESKDCLYVADGMGQELVTAIKLGMTAVKIDVPQDSDYEHDRESWEGLKIASLKEILNLL